MRLIGIPSKRVAAASIRKSGLLLHTAVAAALCLLPSVAMTQEYPSHEMRMVVGFAPGGGADAIARYIADKLKDRAGKPVLVENKVGAAGTISHTYVAKAKPDGYTLLLVGSSSIASVPYLFKTPPVDPLKDFTAVATPLINKWLLLVDASKPWKSLPELTAYLREKKDKGSYSTAVIISTVMAEIYKSKAGLETVQVNYKSTADSIPDLLAGQVDFAPSDPAFSLGIMKNGKVRALGISTAERSPLFPGLPTMTEGGVPMDLATYWMILVPAGTPQVFVDKINGWINDILKTDDAQKFFGSIGADITLSTPEQTRVLLEKEIHAWGEYIGLAKIQPN
jgi:tripartite-type tricarboxylate transporter receptor subunit TctC